MAQGQRKHSAAVAPVAVFSRPTGAAACGAAACLRIDAVRCYYVDGHGHRCATTWCADHWNAIGGIAYCRRHANTIVALGDSVGDPLALPDLDNRGPSLVNWVFRDLDPLVRDILDASIAADQHAVRDSAVTVVIDRDRKRHWERSWRILDVNEEALRTVAVCVDAHDDATVHLLVDGMLVASGVPPWIDRHRRGVEVTQGVDLTQRQIFYSFVIDHIHARMLSRRVVTAS